MAIQQLFFSMIPKLCVINKLGGSTNISWISSRKFPEIVQSLIQTKWYHTSKTKALLVSFFYTMILAQNWLVPDQRVVSSLISQDFTLTVKMYLNNGL
jgi:hypothetical protein